ncbi:MAG: hypothetical protein ACI9M3_000724, partial [Bacteroidia bacterium]
MPYLQESYLYLFRKNNLKQLLIILSLTIFIGCNKNSNETKSEETMSYEKDSITIPLPIV